MLYKKRKTQGTLSWLLAVQGRFKHKRRARLHRGLALCVEEASDKAWSKFLSQKISDFFDRWINDVNITICPFRISSLTRVDLDHF